MTKDNVRRSPASKLKLAATKKKRTAGMAAKFKSSSWYENAIRSISISKGQPHEKRDEAIE